MRNGWPWRNASHGTAAVAASATGMRNDARRRMARPSTTRTPAPAPASATSVALLNCVVPQTISAAAATGNPCAWFSGTKKSFDTNHWPTTAWLKKAKPMSASVG